MNPLPWRIFGSKEADLEGVCRDVYEYYYEESSDHKSGIAVSLIDCRELEGLADVMGDIIDSHREDFSCARGDCQPYFYREDCSYQYDLRDFVVCIGADEGELARLDDALSKCIPYHAETDFFLSLEYEHCCGISTYIPCPNFPNLNEYYKTLDWNEAVHMVE